MSCRPLSSVFVVSPGSKVRVECPKNQCNTHEEVQYLMVLGVFLGPEYTVSNRVPSENIGTLVCRFWSDVLRVLSRLQSNGNNVYKQH